MFFLEDGASLATHNLVFALLLPCFTSPPPLIFVAIGS